MPEYKYRAQDQNGKIVKGRSEAPDESALHKRFHDEGLTLLDATPVVKRVALRPLKKAQLADFARQLGTLTKAGVSLVKSLEIIAHDESIDSYQRDIFLKLRDRIVHLYDDFSEKDSKDLSLNAKSNVQLESLN